MPAGINIYGARTPMVLEWNDANLDYVELGICVYDGLTASSTAPNLPSNTHYELKVPLTGAKCVIDVAPFCRDFIEQRFFTDDRFFHCDVYVKKTISGTTDSGWTRAYSFLTGTGWNYSFQRQNTGIAQGVEVGETLKNNFDMPNYRDTGKYILSDQPWMVVPEFHSPNVPTRFDSENTGGEIVFSGVDFDNSWNVATSMNDLTLVGSATTRYDANASDSTDKICSLPTADSVAEGAAVYWDPTSGSNELIEFIAFKRFCVQSGGEGFEIPVRYTKLCFVNKYGCREMIWFFGARSEEWDIEREEQFQTKRIGMSHDRYKGMTGMNIGKTRRTVTVNTGYAYDILHNEAFRQIILSEQMWLFDNYLAREENGADAGAVQGWKPVNLKSHTWNFNWDRNKYQNATFTFEYADDQIAGSI